MNLSKCKIAAIIPARGGSKGVPKKNVRLINGKPLIAHTILYSLGCDLINRTFVSTDDPEIKRTSLIYGAEVIDRPEKLAGDSSSSEDALLHAIEVMDYKPDLVVFFQCTSPIRREGDVDEAIQYLVANKYDSVFSGSESEINIWEDDGKLKPLTYDPKRRVPRQFRSLQYNENGSFYVFKRKKFEKEENRNCGKIGMYEIPYECSFEIDTEFDFQLCEKILQMGEII